MSHQQEILQKTTLQQPLTDTSTDRCACNGPSYASVTPGTFFCHFEIRAHMTEPTTGRHKCDGPSSGNRRVINEFYPTRPGWTLFKIWPFILPTPPYLTPLLPYSSHLPSLFNFHTSPHWSLLPKSSWALSLSSTSRCCCCRCLPCQLNHSPFVFLSIYKVCVSKFILIYLAFWFSS